MGSPLSQSIRADMKSTSGWIKFVGVCFVITAALFLIFMLLALATEGSGAGILILLVLVVGGAIGAMGYLLILYSNGLSESAEQGTLRALEIGLTRLKSYFIILGILTILIACSDFYTLSKGF
ncbi:hypothetical protein JYT74_03100 [Crocinitomix catalasitica]|nr:hypothetical protein [Crocinitomix catalasitica]